MRNSQQQSYSQKHKNENKNKKKHANFKTDPHALKHKTARFVRLPPCKKGEKCICQELDSSKARNLAIVSVVETNKDTFLPSQPDDDATDVAEAKLERKTCKQLVLEKQKPVAKYKTVARRKSTPVSVPHPLAPPPAIKKRGQVVQERSGSLPLYTATLSRLNISKWKIYKFGEKGSGYKSKTDELQDFESLRDQCLEKGVLFEDPEFPANDLSLYFQKWTLKTYEWKRPKEIVDEPHFFVNSFSRFDIQQGDIGDCWILAAATNLTLHRHLFLQIVPEDQDFFDENYAGIFRFRLWKYGRWIEIVIDDRLPTYKGHLVFLHSSIDNEFWSALLEKAYAKLHGSYESLRGGATSEAMEDFTGGVTELFELNAVPPNFFSILLKAHDRASLMACSITTSEGGVEMEPSEGLITGHAYSLTGVTNVMAYYSNGPETVQLLRLKNPWGNEREWKGAWCDGSPEWRFISDVEKDEIDLKFQNDGEFWMCYEDFIRRFTRIEICNLNPDSLSAEELIQGNKKRWEISVFEGKWVCGITAGGCRNFLDTFWHNPQYRVTLTEADDDDDTCTMIVALMQKNRGQHIKTVLLTIGFTIYYLQNPHRLPRPLDMKFFKYTACTAKSQAFINLREITSRYKFRPGTYCIIPSTFDPKEEGEFLLRVFTEKPNIMEENEEQIGYRTEVAKKVKAVELKETVYNKEAEEPDRVTEEGNEETPMMLSATSQEKQETVKVYQEFERLAGNDGEIDWSGLKEILDNSLQPELKISEFSKDICRSLVAMLDVDCSGKLSIKEFQKLWESVQKWKKAWISHDAEKSGTFNGYELRDALKEAGYSINTRLLNILMHRYGDRSGDIIFEDFMICVIKLKTMIDAFEDQVDEQHLDVASFTMEEFLERTLYC